MVQTANSVQKAVDAVHDLLCFYECSSENFNVGPNVTHRNTRASTAVDPVPVRLSPLPENSAVVFGVEYDSKDDIELQSMNSMTESVVTRGKNGFLSINNIDPNDETFQLELHDGFTACDEHLTSCRASLKIAKSIQAGLVMTLKNGVHEPEIFSK